MCVSGEGKRVHLLFIIGVKDPNSSVCLCDGSQVLEC